MGAGGKVHIGLHWIKHTLLREHGSHLYMHKYIHGCKWLGSYKTYFDYWYVILVNSVLAKYLPRACRTIYIYIEYLGNHQKYRVRYGSLVIVMCGLYGNHCTHTVHIQHISGYKWYLQ